MNARPVWPTESMCRILWTARPDGWSAARRRWIALNSLEDTINKNQLLFGINQGGTFAEISVLSMPKQISELDLDGYAIGGLAVGETHEEMY